MQAMQKMGPISSIGKMLPGMKMSEKKSDIERKTKRRTNKQKKQEWLQENKEAIEKQNERIEREGSFSDVYRRF